MQPNQTSKPNSSKQTAPEAGMLAFLGLLNQISTSAEISEFCTPGHKAGRAFDPLLNQPPAGLQLVLIEETS